MHIHFAMKIRKTPQFSSLIQSLILGLLVFSTLLTFSTHPSLSKEPRLQNRQISKSSITQYIQHNPIEVEDDIALENASSSGTGTPEDPFIIENLKITNFYMNAIRITNTTKDFIIRNCWIDGEGNSSSMYGIIVGVLQSGSPYILNNVVRGCSGYGITMFFSENGVIEGNYCEENFVGILVAGFDIIVSNNECFNNSDGIYTYPTGEQLSRNIKIINNSFTYNNNSGINLQYTSANEITGNEVSHNKYGIFASILEDSTISFNLLEQNSDYGIFIMNKEVEGYPYSTKGNSIYFNTIIDNGNLTIHSQAFDNGTYEFWYDPERLAGNHWSDWNGTGNYSIDGGPFADLYPLRNYDFQSPIMNHPEDLIVKYHSNAAVTWNCSDDHPASYSLYLNNTLVESGSWNRSLISYSVHNLSVDIHYLELVVYDENGLSSSDMVTVTVYPIPQDILDKIFHYPDVFGIGIIIGVVIELGLLIFFRIRKR